MENYAKFKAAAVQAAPVFLNLEATVDKTCRLVDEAAANGAKVIAFPEAFIPGYPWWIWLGNADYGMKYYIQLYKNAVEIPSQSIQKLSEAARRNKVYFCVSVTEKEGGSLYLTQLWFDPAGSLIGKHRKLKATNAEKTIWGDGDGSMMPVFNTEFGNLGGLQCWEHLLPLNIAAMASMNEQVHVSSWPIFMPYDGHLFGTDACETAAKFYAISNQVFCLMASQIWTEEMRDIVGETEYQKNYMQLGHGCTKIMAPNGTTISNTLAHDEEGIAYADVDLEQIIPGKFLIDHAGHYSTPGFLSLTFDKTVHKPVKTIEGSKPQTMTYEEIQFTE
ncbi:MULTISPECIES: carbon-nitrogen hydrolase family protein [unclassified Paenibacillus]|uniref:carbon-nitrogen hydrolase family protein n=1 Tax=unclassified Paenibacillus TaxID=185978 RepID=UPI002406081C|nr:MULTISPECIES: carbon-nitrogen hydrolase family protein [unclassified Paenibacillus]MDF9839516.1 putative amidohydrolase [Paenibacillus sp. PastF-2]MDF9846097.1 putative amidohydrolase [Paenibacillus sp. PastM-2]MDF9852670.1 putative amidohydrolase [Paenibacillus sp. PastF-1]MDH6477599.1 putative amidohydrolase [Paenibacillus sp. PastH-2]MDH6505342.1 putative amidohydrolase [Paenibacillus sp. PastM-3]